MMWMSPDAYRDLLLFTLEEEGMSSSEARREADRLLAEKQAENEGAEEKAKERFLAIGEKMHEPQPATFGEVLLKRAFEGTFPPWKSPDELATWYAREEVPPEMVDAYQKGVAHRKAMEEPPEDVMGFSVAGPSLGVGVFNSKGLTHLAFIPAKVRTEYRGWTIVVNTKPGDFGYGYVLLTPTGRSLDLARSGSTYEDALAKGKAAVDQVTTL